MEVVKGEAATLVLAPHQMSVDTELATVSSDPVLDTEPVLKEKNVFIISPDQVHSNFPPLEEIWYTFHIIGFSDLKGWVTWPQG